MATIKSTPTRHESLIIPLSNTDPPNVSMVSASNSPRNVMKHGRQYDQEMKTREEPEDQQRLSLAHALEFVNSWKQIHSNDDLKNVQTNNNDDDQKATFYQIAYIPSSPPIVEPMNKNIERINSEKESKSNNIKKKNNMNPIKKKF